MDIFKTPLVLVQFIIPVSQLISDLTQQAQECLYNNSVRTIAASVRILGDPMSWESLGAFWSHLIWIRKDSR